MMDCHDKLKDYNSQGAESSFSESQTHGAFHSHFIESVQPLIELIDFLRLTGIDKDVDLPSIAVVGDQGSGKSSVLEALSGLALPRGSEGTVTRCPLELKLRKLKNGPWSGNISYSGHKEHFDDPLKVDNLIREAQNKLDGNAVGISDEVITLEILSPDVCDLTLIDLPGITRVPVHGQPEDIGDQVKNIILRYITKSQTIILVVVPCNADIATTEALRMAQDVDPEGYRTLVLTKPDLIDRGAEIDVLDIVQGKVNPLSKGYIIVRCRGQSDINNKIPLSKAMEMEMHFFRNHSYFSSLLKDGKASIQCLAYNLTKELIDPIKKSLPYLIEQIQTKLLIAQREIKNYNQGPPLEEEKMEHFLSEIIIKFSDQINELCITGHSKDRNIFALLRPEFKKWDTYLRGTEVLFTVRVYGMIDKYNEKHRGRELLTFNDFCKFESIIKDHVAALQEPAIATLKHVREIVQNVFRDICYSSFNQYPPLRHIVSKMINDIQSSQEAKVEERIKEFIDIEQLVFTQDKILQEKLNVSDIPQKTGMDSCGENLYGDDDTIFNSKGCALLDTRYLVPDKLILYHEIIYQRFTDYVPMLIILFMLKDAAKILQHQMLELRNGADVVKLLKEDSEQGRRRADLKQRLELLTQAQKLSKRFWY